MEETFTHGVEFLSPNPQWESCDTLWVKFPCGFTQMFLYTIREWISVESTAHKITGQRKRRKQIWVSLHSLLVIWLMQELRGSEVSQKMDSVIPYAESSCQINNRRFRIYLPRTVFSLNVYAPKVKWCLSLQSTSLSEMIMRVSTCNFTWFSSWTRRWRANYL